MLGIDGPILSWPTKRQIFTVVLQNCEKPATKHSIVNRTYYFILLIWRQYFWRQYFCPRFLLMNW